MGAVDLVLQIESPKSVARGLQRIGRAGHGVDEVSRGRIFPKFRGDLLECAVVARRMHEGLIEPTVVPRNALDVLAQQIVAIAVSAEPANADGGADHDECGASRSTSCTRSSRARHSYSELSLELLENVLDMLDGRYPSKEFGELRARIVWDRVARHDPRAQGLAPAGDRQRRHDPRPRAVRGDAARRAARGRARRGDGLRGASRPGVPARRLDVADRGDRPRPRDRHARARRARGGAVLEGRLGRAPEGARRGDRRVLALGRRAGRRRRWSATTTSTSAPRATCSRTCASSRTPRACCRASARSCSSASATRSATGACACSRRSAGACTPPGAWRSRARIRERFGLEADAIWSDDGIVLHLPDLDADDAEALPSAAELMHARARRGRGGDRRRARRLGAVRRALSRERLARAADPARLPGQTHAAVAAAAEGAEPARGRAPLRRLPDRAGDLPRVPARRARRARAARAAARAALARDLARRGGDADGLAVRLLAAVRLRRHVHVRGRHAQRRAPRRGAVARPRPAARAARPGGAARADRPRRAGARRGRPAASIGDHARDRARRRCTTCCATSATSTRRRSPSACSRASTPTPLLAELAARTPRDPPARRRRASATSPPTRPGLYRDALGAVPPGGLPEAFLADVPDALRVLVARYARTHGPFTDRRAARALRRRRRARCCASSSATATLVRGELRPAAASEREWCDVEVLRRLRRASLAALRKEIEPADQRAPGRVPAVLAGRRPPRRRRRGHRPPARGARAAAGPRAAGGDLGARRAAAPHRRLLALVAGRAVRERRARVGRRRARSGARGRVALYFREDAAAIGPPPARAPARRLEPPRRARARAAARAARRSARASSPTCSPSSTLPAEALREALWDLVWAGEATNDAWAPLRAPRLALARAGAERPGGARRAPAALALQLAAPHRRAVTGPGPLVADRGRCSAAPTDAGGSRPSAAACSRSCCSSATGSSRASRCSRRGSRAASRCCTTRSPTWRRSASAAAATSSRAWAARSSRCPARSSACARRAARRRRRPPHARARRRGSRPALRRGAALAEARGPGAAAPSRVAGAYVVLVEEEPVLYVERGGRGLHHARRAPRDGPRARCPPTALAALADAVRAGRVPKLALERIDGEPAIASELAPALLELGFQPGPAAADAQRLTPARLRAHFGGGRLQFRSVLGREQRVGPLIGLNRLVLTARPEG